MWKRLSDDELNRLRNVLPKLSNTELADLKKTLTGIIRDDFKHRHNYEVITVPEKTIAPTERRKGFVQKSYKKINGFEVVSGSSLEKKILALFTPEVRIRLGLIDGKIISQNEFPGVELRTLTSKKRPGIKGQKGQSIQLTCVDEDSGGLPLDKAHICVLKIKLPIDPKQGIYRNPKAPH